MARYNSRYRKRIRIEPNLNYGYAVCPGTQNLLSLPNCPSEYIDYFIAQKIIGYDSYIAENPNLSISQVKAMYPVVYSGTKYSLIKHPNKTISEYVIKKVMLEEDDRNLRYAFLYARSPIIKKRLLDILISRNSSVHNRTFIAKHVKDPELLKLLAMDVYPIVRRIASKNSNAPLNAKVVAGLLGSKKLNYDKKK